MALELHQAGKPLYSIMRQLRLNGYEVSSQEVTARLNNNGAGIYGSQPGSMWDSGAETFVFNAYNSGQTVAQISAQLCRRGYEAPVVLVEASLRGRGVNI